jgi:uncharacterized flavoprotein (TIGR03862 family)
MRRRRDKGAAMSAPAVIVGAGPAGLMAAEVLSQAGHRVIVFDQAPSPLRKFLLAGRGGLNLTHSEPMAAFLASYGAASDRLRPAIERFPPEALREWSAALGEATFVGSSGRVFPKSFKSSPLARAWLRRLSGVEFRPRARFRGFDDEGGPIFATPDGEFSQEASVVVLALGGASWPRLGSDGGWVEILRAHGVAVAPLRAANCGVLAAWSPFFAERFAGSPLKAIALRHDGASVRGEAMVTRAGLEGGGVYALSASLREAIEARGAATLAIDLKPDVSEGELARRLVRVKGQSMATFLRKAAGLSPVAIALLRETGPLPEDAHTLVRRIKAAPLVLNGIAPIARAISSAGGVLWDELDAHFMLKRLPGVFVAGEMLDWEAPTGGYLLQACFSTGFAAGQRAAGYAASI